MAATVALCFASALFIPLLSVFFLGEQVGPRRWLAVNAGFAGVLVLVRPGSALFNWAALLPVLAGLIHAIGMVIVPYTGGIVLTLRGDNDNGTCAVLQEHMQGNSRIEIVDETMSRKQLQGLIANSDVFISLHRAEGFGFGCAEALAAGKAVVATDYSGTTDFINHRTGYPVAWKPVVVPAGEYFTNVDSNWAEPEIEDAADKLRHIFDHREEAIAKATTGFELLKKEHSIDLIGNKIRKVLIDNEIYP